MAFNLNDSSTWPVDLLHWLELSPSMSFIPFPECVPESLHTHFREVRHVIWKHRFHKDERKTALWQKQATISQ